MAGYGMNGSGAVRFTDGLRAGLFDARAARRDEMQMEGMQEDREYLREQRERQSKTQGRQDDEAAYNQEINNALREFMGSGGAKYQKATELLNKFNDSPNQKIGVSRNTDGTFNVGAVDLGGNPVGKPSKFTADDFGKRLYAMSKPEAYFKGVDQKGRYNESERGVLDTATGGFKPHGPGMKKGEVDPSAKHQRLLTNDAVSILQSHFGGRFEGGMWFPDEENKDVAINAMEMAADLIKEGEAPQRAANIAAEKAKQGALPKSRRPAAPGAPAATAASGKPPSDPESYFKALRASPKNKDVPDEELRAYVNQKFQRQ